MGMLFNSSGTQLIVAKLDWKFNPDNLAAIRNDSKRRGRFDKRKQPRRSLARIAYNMRIFPGKKANSRRAKRWYYFLQQLPAAVQDKIRTSILGGIDDKTVLAIKFVSVEGAAIDAYEARVDLPNSKNRILLVTLQTPEAPDKLADPPKPDPDEPPTFGGDAGEGQDPPDEDFDPDPPDPASAPGAGRADVRKPSKGRSAGVRKAGRVSVKKAVGKRRR
jgi:hypothetical protein